MRVVLAIVLIPFGCAAGITWWALEWDEVAVLHTHRPDGSERSTRIWYALADTELRLEAGTPENGWYLDIQHDPEVRLSMAGELASYRAEAMLEPSRHDEIRALLREKYGFRDWWVSLLFDTSRSVEVRLIPLP